MRGTFDAYDKRIVSTRKSFESRKRDDDIIISKLRCRLLLRRLFDDDDNEINLCQLVALSILILLLLLSQE